MLWVFLFAAAALGVAAVIVYQHTKGSPAPYDWGHEGTPPPGADEALRVLAELSGIRGGVVEWRSAPWPLPYDGAMASGQVLDLEANRIACLDIPSLVHEIDHLRRRSYREGTDGWVARALSSLARAGGGGVTKPL